jgi:hypothetical protein
MERAKVSSGQTVTRAQRQLIKDGWLELVEGSDGESANIWKLRQPEAQEGDQPLPILDPNEIEDWAALDPPPSIPAEVFRYKRGSLGKSALGKTAGRIYSAVLHWGPIKAAELGRLLGYSYDRGVKAQLKKLQKHKLVAPFGKGDRSCAIFWWVGAKHPFHLDDESGLSDETQRQHDRHSDAREAWRVIRKLQDPETAKRMDDGSIVDVTNGQTLLDEQGNRVGTAARTDAPSANLGITPDENGADRMERFLGKLGARVTQDANVRRIQPPPFDRANNQHDPMR